VARAKAEEGRVAVRNIRRHALETVKRMEKDKDHPIGEDEVARAEKRLDAATKKNIESVDAMLKAKEQELMAV